MRGSGTEKMHGGRFAASGVGRFTSSPPHVERAAETRPMPGIALPRVDPANVNLQPNAKPLHFSASRSIIFSHTRAHTRSASPTVRLQATMTTQASTSGPVPAPSGGVPLPIPASERQQYFDNSIWYTLALWPALTTAVQNSFGGPDSSDKRDWFAGAISELFASRPDTDHDDLVVFLLQVMEDEFDVRVEDESEEEIAAQVVGCRKKILGDGERGVYDNLVQRWKGRGKMKVELREMQEEEGEWSDLEDDGDDDVAMGGMEDGEAPQLASAPKEKKEKALPEIDEEGFEKVLSRKKR